MSGPTPLPDRSNQPDVKPGTSEQLPPASAGSPAPSPLIHASFTHDPKLPPASPEAQKTVGTSPSTLDTSANASADAQTGALHRSRVGTFLRELVLVAPSLPKVSDKFPLTVSERASFCLSRAFHLLGQLQVTLGVTGGTFYALSPLVSGKSEDIVMLVAGPAVGLAASVSGLLVCHVGKRLQQEENSRSERARERWERDGKPAPFFTRDTLRKFSMFAGLVEPTPDLVPRLRTDLTVREKIASRVQCLAGSTVMVGSIAAIGKVCYSLLPTTSLPAVLTLATTGILGHQALRFGGIVAIRGMERRLQPTSPSDAESA